MGLTSSAGRPLKQGAGLLFVVAEFLEVTLVNKITQVPGVQF